MQIENLREGESVLYIGYPMSMGIDSHNNFPLSRVGIISQIRPGSQAFIIDGFAQHGHSGSPVFRIKSDFEKDSWEVALAGIATSYPREYGTIFEEVVYKKKSGHITIMNPGFTYVLSMNSIIPILDKY